MGYKRRVELTKKRRKKQVDKAEDRASLVSKRRVDEDYNDAYYVFSTAEQRAEHGR